MRPQNQISIHAPTRGATYLWENKYRGTWISIHAPTRGATFRANKDFFRTTYFNPRSHERSDINSDCVLSSSLLFQSTLPREERHGSSYYSYNLITISIHAPTRGATTLWSLPRTQKHDFNPRSHERSDLHIINMLYLAWKFQSTLPREERLTRIALFEKAHAISIHAPTRGATAERHGKQYDLDNFNPRSHERSDSRCPGSTVILLHISIHAPTRGATAILHKKFVYFYTIPTINI